MHCQIQHMQMLQFGTEIAKFHTNFRTRSQIPVYGLTGRGLGGGGGHGILRAKSWNKVYCVGTHV